MSKRAIILAGGKGTRLYPYTLTLPKPLVPLGEYPILEVIIRQLAQAGFHRITLAVNHQAEIIKAFFQDGARWGVHIDYSLEDAPLGTMGPLKRITDLPEHFLIMNGDILTDLDYAAFYSGHIASGLPFTISSHLREQLVDYGVLDTFEETLINLREKPRLNYEVSMGIYMASHSILSFIPPETAFGFDHLMHAMIRSETPVRVARFKGYWLDIGRPDDYKAAADIFEKNQHVFLPVAA